MSLLQVSGLCKRFGKKVVLEDINLSVEENEIFGIIGINGSGKTTLLKLLVGYYKPDKGLIFYDNQPLKRALKRLRQECGFTTQESSFYPKLTVLENIRYFGSLYGLPRKQLETNTHRIITLIELEEVTGSLAENLSGGMQRRLDMACSLIHNPRILMLDEPTEDLDPLLRKDVLRLIRKINSLGTTVVITSHLLDDIENLCHRIAILHNRRCVNIGTIEELRQMYKKREEVHMETASGTYDGIIQGLNITEFLVEDGKLVIYTDDAERTLHNILHIIENQQEKLLYVDVRKPSLREVFETLTNKKWLES